MTAICTAWSSDLAKVINSQYVAEDFFPVLFYSAQGTEIMKLSVTSPQKAIAGKNTSRNEKQVKDPWLQLLKYLSGGGEGRRENVHQHDV